MFIPREGWTFLSAGRERLSCILGVSADEASRFQDTFLQTYREVPAFIQHTIQHCHKHGSAVDLAKMAMIKICSQVASVSHTARLEAQIHDALLFQVEISQVEQFASAPQSLTVHRTINVRDGPPLQYYNYISLCLPLFLSSRNYGNQAAAVPNSCFSLMYPRATFVHLMLPHALQYICLLIYSENK
ncbi:DNA polymerase nu-like isoform X2 [Cyprinus carpio]|uniref:DNA polymerase nu-like isoform X2 n=1 Tax=Cyprinus carpio TaxID=7962 RepID=A0A9R0AZA3_CYPCA|nr:DNA polymerase nu-like isoform X2 [Cyprinus carpio]